MAPAARTSSRMPAEQVSVRPSRAPALSSTKVEVQEPRLELSIGGPREVIYGEQQVYKLTIDMWSTSNVFKKGHMLRLEVLSSNFPRFDRNLNTGEDNARGKRFVSATNTVLHDAEHPSALTLPVVR